MVSFSKDYDQVLKALESNYVGTETPDINSGYSRVSSAQKNIGSSATEPTLSFIEMMVQLGVLYGGSYALEAIDKAKNTPEAFKKQYNSSISELFEKHKFGKTPEEFSKINRIDYYDIIKKFNLFGTNSLNRWTTMFIPSKKNNVKFPSTSLKLLSYYCSEFNFSGFNIQTEKLDLGFSENQDISNIEFKEFSCSFFQDRRMILNGFFMTLIDMMKNLKTGRYGYKKDYCMDVIFVLWDSYNYPRAHYIFSECILSGYDGLIGELSEEALKTISATFTFSKINSYNGRIGQLTTN